MPNHIPRHKQPRTPRRTIIVDIINRYLRHSELIEHSLAACGIAVAVAGNALFDVVVVYLGIEHGFHASFESEFGIIYFSTGFDEFGHAYAEDVDGLFCFDHFGGLSSWRDQG